MTELDLMRLLRRLESQSRREYVPPGEGSKLPMKENSDSSQPVPPPIPMHHGRGRIISVLSRNAGISQKELSERLAIRPQSLSDVLSKLETDGIICRERSETDKREILLYLTESGRKIAENVHRHRTEHAASFFSALSEEEKETLGSLLEKLCLANEETKQ